MRIHFISSNQSIVDLRTITIISRLARCPLSSPTAKFPPKKIIIRVSILLGLNLNRKSNSNTLMQIRSLKFEKSETYMLLLSITMKIYKTATRVLVNNNSIIIVFGNTLMHFKD